MTNVAGGKVLTPTRDVAPGDLITVLGPFGNAMEVEVSTGTFFSENGTPDEILEWKGCPSEKGYFDGVDSYVCFVKGHDKNIGEWRYQAFFVPEKPGSKKGFWEMGSEFVELG